MKLLSIPEQRDLDVGDYGPACEGFIDTIKSLFIKNPQRDRAQALSKEKYPRVRLLEKELERDLALTYDNPKWVAKQLTGESGIIKIKALEHANLDGKAITNPAQLAKVAQGMLTFLRQMVQHEKPFIERRLKLIKQIEHETNPEKVDAFWEAHKDELLHTAVDRMRSIVKKPVPALGFAGDEKQAWPFNFKPPLRDYFNDYCKVSTDGSLEAPSPANAKVFASAIRELMEIVTELQKLEKDVYIPYWESGLAVEYDDLVYGDDLYDYLFSSQSSWDWELQGLVGAVEYELGVVICGLYIAMFDKHMVAKVAANEGWVDRVKNVFTPKKRPDFEFYGTRGLAKLIDFLAHSDQYHLSGMALRPADKVYLAMDGKSPNLDHLADAYRKTITEAYALSKLFEKDMETHARLCRPLIERFEKTMIDNMDKDGNIEQEILDQAMIPLIEAVPKAQQSFYYTFAATAANQCKHWLGGNPFEFYKERGEWRQGYTELKPVAVAPLKDLATAGKLAEVFMTFSDHEHPWFKGDMFRDMEDEWVSYEFDRPVRHLRDMMNEEQEKAIDIIYSHEDNSQSLHNTLNTAMNQVFYSLIKLLHASLVKNQA